MNDKLLVPLDHSLLALDALEYSLVNYPEATITVLHVSDPGTQHYFGGAEGVAYSGKEFISNNTQKKTSKIFSKALSLAAKHDTELTVEKRIGYPSNKIVEYAEKHEIGQIIMGTHGYSGLKRLLFKSVTREVIHQSTVPVTVVRRGEAKNHRA